MAQLPLARGESPAPDRAWEARAGVALRPRAPPRCERGDAPGPWRVTLQPSDQVK
jgi:hypothetical protein